MKKEVSIFFPILLVCLRNKSVKTSKKSRLVIIPEGRKKYITEFKMMSGQLII